MLLCCSRKVFPKGEILFRSFKERAYIERESVASSSPNSLLFVVAFYDEEKKKKRSLGSFRALAKRHAREREEVYE